MSSPPLFRLKDYRPPPYLIPTVELTMELDAERTTVRSKLSLQRNPTETESELFLNGEGLDLKKIQIDGRAADSRSYRREKGGIVLLNPKEEFILETEVVIHPLTNTQLEGLYLSGNILCTQCEAEGFRHITYSLDRPDVLSVYTVTLIADQERYPVLLSNGNRTTSPVGIGKKTGKRQEKFVDPFPKPAYLFAVVAGDLEQLKDEFITRSDRKVNLEFYSEPGKIDQCRFAMEALKASMKWDEETYGLEYDLDDYKVVAVDAFNLGAMENKGLNIFNSALIFYDKDTATDADQKRIAATIAHEYFHNWTGNRVTIRDWFQLTLKEGLTVYRDRCFSADHYSPVVEKIRNTSLLRSLQFPEDSGPLAHPIQPQTYESINNFYTLTVYEKGAEVVGMYETILGKRKFIFGVQQFLHRFDGQAVTIDDFFYSMQSMTSQDLTPFKRWYTTSGTPTVTAETSYHPSEKTFQVRVSQSLPQGPDILLPIPLNFSINLIRKGRIVSAYHGLWLLSEKEETRVFSNIETPPRLSLNENFSAPVKVIREFGWEEWIEQFRYELNPFLKWDALQQCILSLFIKKVDDPDFDLGEGVRRLAEGMKPIWEPITTAFSEEKTAWNFLFYGNIEKQYYGDCSFLARLLTFPTFLELVESMPVIDFSAIHSFIREFQFQFTTEMRPILETVYCVLDRLHSHPEETIPDHQDRQLLPQEKRNIVGEREVKNRCLKLLVGPGNGDGNRQDLAIAQWESAQKENNFNDELLAFKYILLHSNQESERVSREFYKKWRKNNLVINRWLEAWAEVEGESTLEKIVNLQNLPEFNLKEPNKCRALFRNFIRNNPFTFNHPSGKGYLLIANVIIQLDAINPIMAADLLSDWIPLKKLGQPQRSLMLRELKRIQKNIHSKDVKEILRKRLS